MTRITTTALRIEVCKLSRDTLSALDRSLLPPRLCRYTVGISSGNPQNTFGSSLRPTQVSPFFPFLKVIYT